MSIIFQLFCAEDLQKLTHDQLMELRNVVSNALKEVNDHPPSLHLNLIDKTALPAGAPQQVHEALNKRFHEVSYQLKSPQLYPSRQNFDFDRLLRERNSDTTRNKEDLILTWAISCEVNNYEFYNTLARVRDEAYSFFLGRTGQRPKGPDTLYSPFNPLHPLYRLFIDAQVETIETLSKSQYALLVQREPSPHGEQRIVFDNDLPLAIAIVDTSDPASPDFTLGWPISGAKTLLVNLLQSWLYQLLPGYSTQANSMTLEYYIRERFYTHILSAPVSPEDILVQVTTQSIPLPDDLTFLLLNAEDNVLEISFANGMLVQCACTLREVRLQPLIDFFRAYHTNRKVSEDVNLSKQIFSTPEQFLGGLDFLHPVPVVS